MPSTHSRPNAALSAKRRQVIQPAWFCVLALLAVTLWGGALQAETLEAEPAFLLDYNTSRLSINRVGMGVLLGWSVVNIGAGAVGHFTSEGRWQSFHQMNAGWNVVNLAIASFGLYQQLNADPASFDLLSTVQETENFQKMLLPNIGLDVAYMVGGAWLWERGRRVDSVRQEGFGQSVLLQGAFLMAFDVALFVLSLNHAEELYLHLQPGPVTSLLLQF